MAMARETFTSLKACHQARRIAAEIFYKPLELHERCPKCGHELVPRLVSWNTTVCSDCGAVVHPPAHVFHHMLREEAAHPHEPLPAELAERDAAVFRREDYERLRKLRQRASERKLIWVF